MSPSVRENLAKASRASDRLAALLCLAGSAEPAAELSLRLVRMSDDARVLAGALERMAERDADQRSVAKAEREREYTARKKALIQQCEPELPMPPAVESAAEIASEAVQSAVEQAIPMEGGLIL